MAKRRVRRIVRARLVLGLAVVAVLVFLYGYWAPFPYRPAIVAAARQNQLNPYFVAAVVRVESGFRPTVVSRRGAVGLMQLMPSSAEWVASKSGLPEHPDLTDPRANIRLGTWYLKYLLKTYHNNPVLALAAYNGGPATVDGWLEKGVLSPSETGYNRIPYPETANFVRRVTQFEQTYRWMYGWLSFRKH